jgi:hypothetical protein
MFATTLHAACHVTVTVTGSVQRIIVHNFSDAISFKTLLLRS